jgi:hypothetical protein
VAKKRQLIFGDPIGTWKTLDSAERFRVLLNHYETVEQFSRASDIPLKSVWGYVSALDKNKKINPEKFKKEISKARKKMTSSIARFKKSYKGEEPVLTKTLFLRPYVPMIEHPNGDNFLSDWVFYRTEHLTWPEILSVLRELYENRSFTGFNLYRFEYVAIGSLYLEHYDNYSFADEQLQKQYQLNGVIKLSTQADTLSPPWGRVLDKTLGFYELMKRKGMIRISSIAVSKKGGSQNGNGKKDSKTSLKRR